MKRTKPAAPDIRLLSQADENCDDTRLFKRLGERILNHEYSLASDFSEASLTRVSEYLLQFCDRLVGAEYVKGTRLHLPMSKTLLASYLGMSADSFSRILAQLEKDGPILNLTQAIEIANRERIETSRDGA